MRNPLKILKLSVIYSNTSVKVRHAEFLNLFYSKKSMIFSHKFKEEGFYMDNRSFFSLKTLKIKNLFIRIFFSLYINILGTLVVSLRVWGTENGGNRIKREGSDGRRRERERERERVSCFNFKLIKMAINKELKNENWKIILWFFQFCDI